MNNFTFLTDEQIFGNNQLDIISKYGTKCAITDFSILLGGYVSSNYYTSEGNTRKDRTGWWWTKSSDGDNDACIVSEDSYSHWDYVNKRNGGARPALPYSSIQSITSNGVRGANGIKEIEYGEYPQTIVDENYSRELERAYNNGSLRTTGKNYTTDSVRYQDIDTSFRARTHTEYEYNGSKYIRFVGDSNCDGEVLSDGRTIQSGNTYWVRVEPITWLVDERANIALSKKLIFSGVQFKNRRDYQGDFDRTDIKQFIDNYFSKDILTTKTQNNILDLSNIDLSLLEEKQIFGDKQLNILKKYGTKCEMTDLSVISGGYVSSVRTGWWWTKTPYNGDARVVYYNGNNHWYDVRIRSGGLRPALPYSLIRSISSNEVRGINEIKIIECGEYPQMAADSIVQKELETARENGSIAKTGKIYTFDQAKYTDYDKTFDPIMYNEFLYNGKKYIRVKVNSYYDGKLVELSNGIECKDNDYVWIEVLPIEWLVDEKENIALSKKILVSGIRYADSKKYDGNFANTEMKEYLDKYMKKEMFESITLANENSENKSAKKELIRKQNPYDFNFDNVSEEDIIRGAIESKISVFLHGRSSEGKSARVKELDPDCEIIYMRNATPDSLNGKSVYNSATGEMIDVPPTWYSKVKEKCDAEPNKIHIVFFDELTNALPSIQGMAFNIILDGEVNGKWKLPSNARIVAAGNDLNDSLAANQMAEPLFNRFAHVYINTTVDDWLKWASTPEEKYERLNYKEEKNEAKIHPSIYAYIAYKSYSGHDVLRTPYTGDKPNADPRKWEMASKVLYKTKQPEMLRALIGEDLTRDFVAFAKKQVISVEDVINHNYSDRDLEMDISQKFATAVGLSSVDEEHFEVVRDFMKRVGAEPRAAFESMWCHGDERRLEHLAEIQLADSLSQGGVRR